MRWAKTHPAAEFDLAASNMLACTLDDLEGAREALALTADNDEGYQPLIDAIARHHGVPASRVMTGQGCAGANFLVIATLVRPGSHVLVESPGYDPLAGACRLFGATVTAFTRRREDGFAVDPAAVRAGLRPDTSLVILSSPNNPTGATLDRDTILALGALSDETGVPILIDEVYLDIVRLLADTPERFPRAATVCESLITTSSLTKSYGLAGLRTGWAIVPPGMADRLRATRDVVDGNGSAVTERLATLAFAQIARLGERARKHLSTNHAIVRRFLDAEAALTLDVPLQASILFPRLVPHVAGSCTDADALAARAAHDFGVTVVPGRFFGEPSHIRLAAAGDTRRLPLALDRLSRALAQA
jgi:aspartate/methionine/tyrosine aminotransferase